MSILQRVAQVSLGTAAVGYTLQEMLFDVDGGHRAVMFDRFRGGVLDKVYGEGTHFRIPLIQEVFDFDVRIRPNSIATNTGTKDMQMVNISMRVLSRPNPDKMNTIYQEVGMDYDSRVFPSIGPEVLKAVVGQYNADHLLTMREKVSHDIRDQLQARAQEFNIVIEDVSITHLTFGKEYTQAIERKQVAQQEAEQHKFIVQRAEQERKAAIIRAEGESESAQLISDATKKYGSAMIEIRRIEAAKTIAATLARSRNVTYLPSGNNMLLNVPI